MPDDALDALIDELIAQAQKKQNYYDLSLPSLYRLFLSIYDHDPITARKAFTQYMQGEIPRDVIAYCRRMNQETRMFGFKFHQCSTPWDDAPAWAIELREMLALILNREEIIMSAVDDLATDVAAEDTVIDGAVALINGFAAALAAAGTDPAKLAALRTDIQTKTATLAAAVLAGTPTAPASASPVTPAAAQAAATSAVASA